MKIIYQNNTGICVVHALSNLPIEELASKDVPFGKPYLIVEDNVIPATKELRAAWTADFSVPNGTGLGAQRWFIKEAEKEIARLKTLEGDQAQLIAAQQAIIATMKAEVFALEGVRL